LESIALVLLALKDDIKKMSIDMAEVRVELKAVNAALGIATRRSVLIYAIEWSKGTFIVTH
jgi:hypothetical protein